MKFHFRLAFLFLYLKVFKYAQRAKFNKPIHTYKLNNEINIYLLLLCIILFK
jgi:hypothetical protein